MKLKAYPDLDIVSNCCATLYQYCTETCSSLYPKYFVTVWTIEIFEMLFRNSVSAISAAVKLYQFIHPGNSRTQKKDTNRSCATFVKKMEFYLHFTYTPLHWFVFRRRDYFSFVQLLYPFSCLWVYGFILFTVTHVWWKLLARNMSKKLP
jgi:hypothetical protein